MSYEDGIMNKDAPQLDRKLIKEAGNFWWKAFKTVKCNGNAGLF